MKKLVLLCMVLLLFSCKEGEKNTVPQSDEIPKTTNPTSDSSVPKSLKTLHTINDIKQEYALINQAVLDNRLDTLSYTYDCDGEKAGKVNYFFKEDTLRLIEHTYNEYSHFSAEERYYVKNDEPFFIFNKSVTWSFSGGTAEKPGTRDDIKEQRFYILEKEAVNCLEKKYQVFSEDSLTQNADQIANTEINCEGAQAFLKSFSELRDAKENIDTVMCL